MLRDVFEDETIGQGGFLEKFFLEYEIRFLLFLNFKI